MQTARVLLQVLLLLLMLYLGSVTVGESIRALQDFRVGSFGVMLFLPALQTILEITILVWIYRKVE